MVLIGWLFISVVLFVVLVAAIMGSFAALMHIGEYGMAHPTPYPNLPRKPARWLRDPTGRHQYRFWDARLWTEHVSDDGVISIDPINDDDVFIPSYTSSTDGDVTVRGVPLELPPATPPIQTETVPYVETDYLNELVAQQRKYSELRGVVEIKVEQSLHALEANNTPMALANLRTLLNWIDRANHNDDTETIPPVS